MAQPSANIVDALSGEEVCPLCFDRYSAADECTCVVCRAASCPSCAEFLDADGAVRCFACRPLPSRVLSPVAGALAARPDQAPLSLPRPITLSSMPKQDPDGRAALPFPLTTSPQGVRALRLRPPGSVFVGLPPVAPALASASLGGSATSSSRAEPCTSTRTLEPAERAPERELRLAPRARQKLALLAGIVALSTRLMAWTRSLFLLGELRARLPGYQPLVQQLVRLRLSTVVAQLARARAWLELRGERVGKHVAAKVMPLLSRSKSAVARPDPSRPIHL